MKKRLRKKRIQKHKKHSLEYMEYIWRQEEEYNWELTKLLKKCLPYIPEKEKALRERIEGIWYSWHV